MFINFVEVKLTPVEAATIAAIAESNYQLDGEPTGLHVWTNSLEHKGFDPNQLKGCLPRLVQKGIVHLSTFERGEQSCGLTKFGVEVYNRTPKTATVQNETGAYKQHNGKTFPIVERLLSGYVLAIPLLGGSVVNTDFPAKNIILNY